VPSGQRRRDYPQPRTSRCVRPREFRRVEDRARARPAGAPPGWRRQVPTQA
jgi:hypothetical protein